MNDFAMSEAVRRIEQMVRVATVEEIDGPGGTVKVRWGPGDDAVSDWLHMAQLGSKDVRIWVPQTVGSQVMVLSPGGDTTKGIVMPGPWAGNAPDDRPESLRLTMPGLDLEVVDGKAKLTISDVEFTGNIKVGGDAEIGGISFLGHVHGGVTPGAATTAVPQG